MTKDNKVAGKKKKKDVRGGPEDPMELVDGVA